MICPRCKNEIADGSVVCEHCGAALGFEEKQFKINISDEAMEKDLLEAREHMKALVAETAEPADDTAPAGEDLPADDAEPAGAAQTPDPQPETAAAQPVLTSAEEEAVEDAAEKTGTEGPREETAGAPSVIQPADPEPARPAPKAQSAPTVPAAQSPEPRVPAENGKAAAAAKKNTLIFKLTAVFVAVLIAALGAVQHFTGIFKVGKNENKTVPLSSLSAEEKQSFEEFFASLSPFYESGFDREKVTTGDLLKAIDPAGESGLYHAFFKKTADTKSDDNDPLYRFSAEDDTAGYCVLSRGDAAAVYGAFGMTPAFDENFSDVYFCGENYYFRVKNNATSAQTGGGRTYAVSGSKQTSDGGWYITMSDTSDESKRLYCLADKAEGEGSGWSVSKISASALFDDFGAQISSEDDSGAVDYKMKTLSFEAKDKKGKVVKTYLIEYPDIEVKEGQMGAAAAEQPEEETAEEA